MFVAVAILTTAVLGIPLVLAADRSARGALLAGVAFLYGSALVCFALLLLSIAGIEWSAVNTTLFAIIFSSFWWLYARRRTTSAPPRAAGRRPRATVHPIDILTAWIVGGYSLFATVAPVWFWDFWAIWGLKARVFFEHRGIDWRFLESPFNDFAHPDYPLLVPLNYAWAALLSGGWSDRWLGLYSVAFGIALLLVIRHLAAEELRPYAAATVTLAIAAFALSSSIGLAEAAMIAFGSAGMLMMRRAMTDNSPEVMRHAAILLGCAACTKNEGLSLLVAIGLAMVALAPRRIVALWPAAVVAAPWLIVRTSRHLSTDLVRGSWMARTSSHLSEPAAFFGTLVQNASDRLVWMLLTAAIVVLWLGRRLRTRADGFVLVATAIQFLFFLAAYAGSPWKDFTLHIATSWPRLMRQLAVPIVYVVMTALAREFASEDDLAHVEARSEH